MYHKSHHINTGNTLYDESYFVSQAYRKQHLAFQLGEQLENMDAFHRDFRWTNKMFEKYCGQAERYWKAAKAARK
jgi:hypothetical protein